MLLRHAITKANAESPDLIVLAGDYVDAASHARVAELSTSAANALACLRARYGVYAIAGNHDHLSGEDVIVENLQKAGIPVLRDAKQRVQTGNATLWLIGVEDGGIDVCHTWADFAFCKGGGSSPSLRATATRLT